VTSGVPAADSQWGHSLAVSPMGQVVASAEIDETIVHVRYTGQTSSGRRLVSRLSYPRRLEGLQSDKSHGVGPFARRVPDGTSGSLRGD
jgi:predicted amidohydrolase